MPTRTCSDNKHLFPPFRFNALSIALGFATAFYLLGSSGPALAQAANGQAGRTVIPGAGGVGVEGAGSGGSGGTGNAGAGGGGGAGGSSGTGGVGGLTLVALGMVVQVVASGTQELQYSEIRPAVLALLVEQDRREVLLALGVVVVVVVASVTTLRE